MILPIIANRLHMCSSAYCAVYSWRMTGHRILKIVDHYLDRIIHMMWLDLCHGVIKSYIILYNTS